MKVQQIRRKVENVITLQAVLCPLKSMFKDGRTTGVSPTAPVGV